MMAENAPEELEDTAGQGIVTMIVPVGGVVLILTDAEQL